MADDGTFAVTALRDVDWVIRKGDVVIIDPTQIPSEGKLVLVGDEIVPWNGHAGVRGVAVRVERDL